MKKSDLKVCVGGGGGGGLFIRHGLCEPSVGTSFFASASVCLSLPPPSPFSPTPNPHALDIRSSWDKPNPVKGWMDEKERVGERDGEIRVCACASLGGTA